MSALTDPRAACAGQPDLFESEDLLDHRKAAKICGGCAVVDACRANLEDTIRDYGYGPHVGPRGTWAGRFLAPDYKGREKVDAGMSRPTRCRCGKTYDLETVTVTARYDDCSVWRTPCCGITADDRPQWGGAA